MLNKVEQFFNAYKFMSSSIVMLLSCILKFPKKKKNYLTLVAFQALILDFNVKHPDCCSLQQTSDGERWYTVAKV